MSNVGPADGATGSRTGTDDLFRALLDSMAEGVSLTTEDGIIVYTNPAEDRMFGYGPGEMVGLHVSMQNAYPPEENERVVAGVIAELRRCGRWRGEWLNRRKDGSAFVTNARITAVEIEGRTHWLCVQEDVTEERAALAALRESEARLALATGAAEIGIWDWDLVTDRMVLCDRAKAILGLRPDREATPEALRALIHPEDLPRIAAMSQRGLDPAIRERGAFEYRILHPDGEPRWLLAHGEAIFGAADGAQRAVRYVGTLQDVTGRRRAEEARIASEQRLSLAIEAGRMAVWEVDARTEAVTGSPELNRLLGFPEDATPSLQELRAGYFPGERERLQAIGQAALARGERFIETEYRYIRRNDGSLRWLLLRCEILFDAAGLPDRAVGVVMDVTERKRTEAALRASEARLRLAQRAAGAGIWDWDIPTGHLDWSPEMFDLLGVDPATPPDRLYETWLTVVHPDDRDSLHAAAQATSAGDSYSRDYRIVRPDGEIRWIRAQGTTVLGSDGRGVRATGINIDVTAQHRDEERLRQRAATLETAVEERTRERDRIYELSDDLFAVAGFDGYLRTVNPAWQKLLGYTAEELLARPFGELIHPDDRAAAAAYLGQLREGGAPLRFDDRLVRADGGIVWVAWTAAAEGDRFYAVGRDVTREREREEALRQAQKMEAVGRLTGGIAHDFNNLLQAVQGNLDLIRRRPDDSGRVRRWAEHAHQAAERGSRLTAQLLAFSRAQRLELRPVAVAELLAGIEGLLTRALGPAVQARFEIGAEATAVLADPTQLEMAMLNLAINARDAMPGGGTLTIRTELCRGLRDEELPPGDYLRIDVADTGTGMAPDVAARAFDPFFTTKGLGQGTGLGLSQVYGMARQAGGTARIRTAPGAGTTVSLLLRRTAPADAAAGAEDADRAALPGRGATVLVVDDDADVRQFLVDSLESLGYRTVAAADGPAGLAALDAAAPDLMMVDFAMPGMTGAEVADAARSRRPDLAIVFASGYADTAAIESAVGAEAPMLRKPFRIDELETMLARMLRRA